MPDIVWRLGKIGGGDDYAGFLPHVVSYAFSCAWEPEPLGGTFLYPAAGLPGCDGLYPGAEVAAILDGEEPRNCRFTVHDPVDDVIAGEDGAAETHVKRWTLLNMYHRLGQSVIRPPDDAVILRPKEWQDVAAGVPARFVVHQSHTDGSLEEIQFDFDDAEDSAAVAWVRNVDVTIDRLGVTGLDVIRTEWDAHAFDVWFERRKLRAFNPDSMSVNYGGVGTKIVLADLDLLDAPRTVESRSRATRVWVRGDEDRFAVAALDPGDFTDLDTHVGYLEVTKDASGTKDPAQLQAIADDYLTLYQTPRVQRTLGLNPGRGKDPLVAFQMGDWILLHDGSQADGKPELVRVLRCYYSMGQDGVLKSAVTVDDWLGDLSVRTQRKLEGIVGGLAGAAKPNRNAVAPAAPVVTSVVMTVVAPEHGGLERVKVDITWTWSGLDADGAPCGDLDVFVIRHKYGTHGWTEIEISSEELSGTIRDLDPGRELTVQVGARDEAKNTSWTADLV